MCFLQREITQLQKWMANVFPSTATHFVHQRPGTQVETMGDALEVKLCKPILNYRIETTQDGLSPLVTTTFRLNYLTKIRFTS